MTVYKYLQPARVDVLRNSLIRFTQPSILNDIFETLTDWTSVEPFIREMRIVLARNLGIQLTEDKLREVIKMELTKGPRQGRRLAGDHFLFLSLSRIRDNLLMWSHYADSHRGFVIGFDECSPFFSPGGNKGKDGLREVVYSRHRFKETGEPLKDMRPDNQQKSMEGLLFTKSVDWSYERELRIVAPPERADITKQDDNGQPCYLFSFPVECVQEVILGCEMEDLAKTEVISVVRQRYPDASLLQAEVHTSDFALEITPLRATK